MNKNIIKTLIVIWTVIALGLTGFLIYGLANNRNNNTFNFLIFHPGSLNIQKDESISLENIDKINLNFASDDITIYTTEDSKLRIVQKSSNELKENEKFTMNKNGSTLNIEKGSSQVNFNIFSINNLSRKLELYVPKAYVKDLNIDLSSGDVSFESDIELNNLDCSQHSGDFKASATIIATRISLSADSGDIDAGNLKTKTYDIRTSSGDIDIDSLLGTGKIDASSGDITISYKDIDEFSKVTAQSGDIKLTLPQNLSFEFHGECNSGDITSNFDLNYEGKRKNEATAKVGSAPYKKIDVNTSSGDIKIVQ